MYLEIPVSYTYVCLFHVMKLFDLNDVTRRSGTVIVRSPFISGNPKQRKISRHNQKSESNESSRSCRNSFVLSVWSWAFPKNQWGTGYWMSGSTNSRSRASLFDRPRRRYWPSCFRMNHLSGKLPALVSLSRVLWLGWTLLVGGERPPWYT